MLFFFWNNNGVNNKLEGLAVFNLIGNFNSAVKCLEETYLTKVSLLDKSLVSHSNHSFYHPVKRWSALRSNICARVEQVKINTGGDIFSYIS